MQYVPCDIVDIKAQYCPQRCSGVEVKVGLLKIGNAPVGEISILLCVNIPNRVSDGG